MPKWSKDKREVKVKVALVGQSGSGRRDIIQQLAMDHGHAALRTGTVSETEVARTEFIWPDPLDPLPGGPFVKVRVFALVGNPLHEAAEQVILMDADAIVFVVDCSPDKISNSRDRLIAMMSNATHVELDWDKTVVVMQYHRADRYPNFKPDDLDQWLGIKEGNVARFMTRSNGNTELCVAVDAAVEKMICRLSDGAAAAGSGK